jgi:hypothetical protein
MHASTPHIDVDARSVAMQLAMAALDGALALAVALGPQEELVFGQLDLRAAAAVPASGGEVVR